MNASGTASHGLFLRVNGAAPGPAARRHSGGSPRGRDTAGRKRLVAGGAAAAGFSMIRVWGGGADLPKFLRACDERGLLVYHDLCSLRTATPHGTD